ncbi:hypothetical protein C8J56DRAFT_1059991 [Mycena floridula]|nr:hypothetical protein C8J56DRAFT_1059991 [Mycena floridula]
MSELDEQQFMHVDEQPGQDSDGSDSEYLSEFHDDNGPDLDAETALVNEIDLEIALRKRLETALEARIAWAELLQETLLKSLPLPTVPPVTETAFKDAALQALSAIDAPLDCIFVDETALLVQQALLPPRRMTRLPPKEKPKTRSQNAKKFLYLRSSDPSESQQFFILRCPHCPKTDFVNIQGLYNHARIAHNIEWGNHEACVRVCAFPHPPGEPLDLETGVEVGGSPLPGVPTLFQRAVENLNSQLDGSNHLSRTLGLHSESAALAPFLGKAPTRREIRVLEQENVDILGLGDERSAARPHWRMPYAHRNTPKDILTQTTFERAARDPAGPSGAVTGTRFHFAARVIITDRSKFIPRNSRVYPNLHHTHQWMISVESPSYSHDITTILTRLEVSSLSDPFAVVPPLCATEPPFVVVGTSDKPFISRITLFFNPATGAAATATLEDAQIVMLEHWVELHPGEVSKHVSIGEQQIVDLELDRATVIGPKITGYLPINSRKHWETEDPMDSLGQPEDMTAFANLDYSALLSKLLPQFPMTLKDAKAGRAATLPYRMVATPAQLRSLPMGRRKAIEWGRAIAVCQAYEQVRLASPRKAEMLLLTPGDVYCWLEDEGHFVRTSIGVRTSVEPKDKVSEDTFCSVCGLSLSLHPGVDPKKILATLKAAQANPGPSFQCEIVPKAFQVVKMPVVDIRTLLPTQQPHHYDTTLANWRPIHMVLASPITDVWSPKEIVQAVDPILASAVQRLVDRLKLPTFKTPSSKSRFPVDALGDSPARIEKRVAPAALLAVATQSFLRVLIAGGLEISKRDKELASNAALYSTSTSSRSRRTPRGGKLRALTPMHILAGVVAAERGRGKARAPDTIIAVFGSLMKHGIPVDIEGRIFDFQRLDAGDNSGLIIDPESQEEQPQTTPQYEMVKTE